MDILLMVELAEATKAIFEIGIEPKEADFVSFPEEAYETLLKHSKLLPTEEPLFAWVPPGYTGSKRVILTVTKADKELILAAAANIEVHTRLSGKVFTSYDDKLFYVASIFPEMLSKGTKFAVTKVPEQAPKNPDSET